MKSIVEMFREICDRTGENVGMPINYKFGDSAYINDKLKIEAKSIQAQKNRFPLIGLFTPITEDRTDKRYYCKANVNLVFAINTLSTYSNEERLEISFKQVLIPVYKAFISELLKDARFDFGFGKVEHSYSENYSYGNREVLDVENKKFEPIDAIEIKDLELTIKKERCIR